MRLVIVTVLALLGLARAAQAQRPDYSALLAELDATGTTTDHAGGVQVSTADFVVGEWQVEALAFTPTDRRSLPGLLLIPGHGMTARNWISQGLWFAGAGYVCLAVSQPGYGKSEGPPDFVGPRTIAVLQRGLDVLRARPGVDPARIGLVGYSRGAMAAALLAEQVDGIGAVVLGGGIYDFQRAYDEATLQGIKDNMLAETGMTPEAVAARSALLHAETLTAPVLILHGGKDENSPVGQAFLLADRLYLLGKKYEIRIFPDAGHSIGMANFLQASLDFLNRQLAATTE